MIEKIMQLIKLSRKFNGKLDRERISVNVTFSSNIDGVQVYVITAEGVIYDKTCYLDWQGAEARLDHIKEDLEKMLKEVA